jgi:hypothetical protein
MNEQPKIGCVNHDCDQCKAVQEPVAWGIVASNTGRICQVELDAAEVEGHNPKHIVPLYTTPPETQPAPVQEPVTWVDLTFEKKERIHNECADSIHLAIELTLAEVRKAAPQPVPVKTYSDGKPWPVAPKPWVGLTDAEVMQTMSGDWTSQFYFARAIEAKLKEKNA